jgi:hypothetical protein
MINLETLDTLTEWMKRTEVIFHREITRLRIGETSQLDQSIEQEVKTNSETMLQGAFEFLMRGRFVDMGAGKGARKLETREGNRQLLQRGKGRRPKKWYSRAFWGRLNDLQGIMGYRMMEAAIDSVKDPIEFRAKGNIGKAKL